MHEKIEVFVLYITHLTTGTNYICFPHFFFARPPSAFKHIKDKM